MNSSMSPPFKAVKSALLHFFTASLLFQRRLALRDIHDHARREIKARLDGGHQDVLRIGRMGTEPPQAEPFDDWSLRLEGGERGVGAASRRPVADGELLADLGVDLLRVRRERAR